MRNLFERSQSTAGTDRRPAGLAHWVVDSLDKWRKISAWDRGDASRKDARNARRARTRLTNIA